MNNRLTIGVAILSLSACTVIPTNGNDTTFTRQGSLQCEGVESVDPNLLKGTAQFPVRCGPQTVAVE